MFPGCFSIPVPIPLPFQCTLYYHSVYLLSMIHVIVFLDVFYYFSLYQFRFLFSLLSFFQAFHSAEYPRIAPALCCSAPCLSTLFYFLYCCLLIKFIFLIYLIFLLITTNPFPAFPALTFLSRFTCLSVRFFRATLIVCWNDSRFMV